MKKPLKTFNFKVQIGLKWDKIPIFVEQGTKGNCPEELGYPEKTRCCVKRKSKSKKSYPGSYGYCSYGKIPVHLFYYTVVQWVQPNL